MPNTQKRLAGPAAGTGAEATLYTVPGATSAILRDISVTNTTTTQQTFKMSIGADAAGTRLFHDEQVDPGATWQWNGFKVLNAAETLRWNGPTTLTCTVSGVEVT
jgi:hypothetical protein